VPKRFGGNAASHPLVRLLLAASEVRSKYHAKVRVRENAASQGAIKGGYSACPFRVATFLLISFAICELYLNKDQVLCECHYSVISKAPISDLILKMFS